jgi:hypothetical protein
MSSKKYGSKFLKGLTSFRVPGEVTSLAIEEFLASLDCPRALTALILYRTGEHEQLAKLEFNPVHYLTMVDCRDAYAATKFLSKFKGLSSGLDLDKVAFEKFDQFELLCKQTNNRFRNLASDTLYRGKAVWLHSAVIRKIAKILGDFESDEFFSMPDWGPGASTLIRRREASSVKKFQCETGITRDLYNLIPTGLLEEKYPLWTRQLRLMGFPTHQVGNKVVTVPKDAMTNRVIAIEPGINLWFQKSVGEMIGRRLRRYGVDLRYQTRNQQLALKGSKTNLLATVDLSSASDSIARTVVEELLPPRWFHVMDACRSHYGSRNASTVRWEKFSSMGNGFTFQLESLIFYAVASCCAEYVNISSADVSAYGDDVILPSACFGLFSEMLSFYGFRINEKKSHFDSPFRESCGSHFFSGVDVKPVYLKDRLLSIQAVFRLANAFRRLAHRRMNFYGCDANLRHVFDLLVQRVPKALRLRIPATLGDGGFISNFDEATPSKAKHGIEGYRVVNLVEVSRTYRDETMGYLLASLWSLPDIPIENDRVYQLVLPTQDFPKKGIPERRTRLKAITFLTRVGTIEGYNTVPLRNSTRLKLVNSLVQQWYDLGPWY